MGNSNATSHTINNTRESITATTPTESIELQSINNRSSLIKNMSNNTTNNEHSSKSDEDDNNLENDNNNSNNNNNNNNNTYNNNGSNDSLVERYTHEIRQNMFATDHQTF